MKDPDAIKYPVRKTGFYCVSTYAFDGEAYTAVVTFRNAYGELPAAQIAKLPFYGAMTIVYAVIGMYVPVALNRMEGYRIVTDVNHSFWAFLYAQNRFDICKTATLQCTTQR